jgi:hypothetical protein
MINTKISINPGRAARLLWILMVILVVCSLATSLANFYTGYSNTVIDKLDKLFYVELENNAPSYFSMFNLLLSSMILTFIVVLKKKQGDPYVVQWGVLALGFLYMSFDEISAIHEKLIFPVRGMLGEKHFGVLYFAWVLPAIILVIFLLLYFLKFLRSLPRRTMFLFLLSGVIFLGGAIGFEMIDGYWTEMQGPGVDGKDNVGYIILSTIEETLEMSGIILFIWSLLSYIAETYKEVRLHFDDLSGK